MQVTEWGFTYDEYASMALAEVTTPGVKSNLKEWKLTGAGSYP